MTRLDQESKPVTTYRLLREIRARDGLSLRLHIAVFALALLAIVSRRPGMFLHPQFFAEDGWVWYQQAYNLHWLRSLLLPQAGYMQTLPRLITGLTLLLPLRWAPLLMNLSGAIIQVLPITALLSRRCSPWGPLSVRIALAAIYLAIADASEIHVVLTNAMWHLALLQAIMAFATPPSNGRQRLTDILLFGIGGISGPFCILLFIPVLAYWWIRRQRWTAVILGLMFTGVIIQAVTILHSVRNPSTPLGATPLSFMHLVGGNIIIDSMAGSGGPVLPGKLLLLAFFVGIAIIALGWQSAPLPMRLFIIFAIIASTASLHDPLVYGTQPRWWVISQVPGLRYWFYPSLMFLWAAVYGAVNGRNKLVRLSGFAVLLLTVVGDIRSWRYPPWPDNHFTSYVDKLDQAKPGEHILFPIYPDERNMDLIKR